MENIRREPFLFYLRARRKKVSQPEHVSEHLKTNNVVRNIWRQTVFLKYEGLVYRLRLQRSNIMNGS